MADQDIAAVVASLTAAQREAVLWLSDRKNFPPKHISSSALGALARKGLARNQWSSFMGSTWIATPAGLAVRAHLLQQQDRTS